METEETLPFPPPLERPAGAKPMTLATVSRRSNSPSLEQLTEARLAELQHEGFLWQTPLPGSEQMVLASEKTDKQIVLSPRHSEAAALAPLRWRGLPVSEELQIYALRVARGEDLEPYRGPILADPDLEPPWEEAEARTLRTRSRSGSRLLLALAGVGCLLAFVLPKPDTRLFEASERASLAVDLPLAAANATAPRKDEPAPLPGPLLTEPLPALRQPAPAPAQPASQAPVAPRAAKSRTAHGASAANAAPVSAAAGSSAPKRQGDAHARDAQHGAPPSGEAAGPSMLLLDRPSF